MPSLLDLRRAGIICAETTIIAGEVTLEPPVRLFPGVSVRNSTVGAYSYVANGTRLHAVTCGRYCSLADEIVTSPGVHPSHWLSANAFFYEDVFDLRLDPSEKDFDKYPPISIGNDVWIGARAMIMGGVTIGDGAIVAAAAVVTRDVEPYAIVGGVPAKTIRRRFDDRLVEDLLTFQWWRFDLGAARKAGLVVDWKDPQRALAGLREAEAAGTLPLIPADRKVTLRSGPA